MEIKEGDVFTSRTGKRIEIEKVWPTRYRVRIRKPNYDATHQRLVPKYVILNDIERGILTPVQEETTNSENNMKTVTTTEIAGQDVSTINVGNAFALRIQATNELETAQSLLTRNAERIAELKLDSKNLKESIKDTTATIKILSKIVADAV